MKFFFHYSTWYVKNFRILNRAARKEILIQTQPKRVGLIKYFASVWENAFEAYILGSGKDKDKDKDLL